MPQIEDVLPPDLGLMSGFAKNVMPSLPRHLKARRLNVMPSLPRHLKARWLNVMPSLPRHLKARWHMVSRNTPWQLENLTKTANFGGGSDVIQTKTRHSPPSPRGEGWGEGV